MRWNGTAAFVAACILALATIVSASAVMVTSNAAFGGPYWDSATTATVQHSGHLGTAFSEGVANALTLPDASM